MRLPVQVEDFQVVGTQFVTHIGQQRLGTKGSGKTVGHVTAHTQGVFSGERSFGDTQQIELQWFGVAVLILVDAVKVGLQRFPGRRVLVVSGNIVVGVFTNTQGAE